MAPGASTNSDSFPGVPSLEPVTPSTGWGVVHLFLRARQGEAGGDRLLEDVTEFAAGDAQQVVVFSVLGARADLGVMALASDLDALDRLTKRIQCNWKIFWENFNECLHCPGVHPELCDMVPIYGRGIMSEREDPKWAEHKEDDPRFKGGLKRGNESWTVDGKLSGHAIEGLTEAERRGGYHYMTSLPSMFLVGHPDYMRITYLRPLGPQETELTTEWLFPAATLADPKSDTAKAIDFVTTVLEQDADACELNQRGLRAAPHKSGVLMPEEMYLYDFHQWVKERLGHETSQS